MSKLALLKSNLCYWLQLMWNFCYIYLTSWSLRRYHSVAANSNMKITVTASTIELGSIGGDIETIATPIALYQTYREKLMAVGLMLAEGLKDNPHWLLPYRNNLEDLTVESNSLLLLAALKTRSNNISYWSLPPVSAPTRQLDNVRYVYVKSPLC